MNQLRALVAVAFSFMSAAVTVDAQWLEQVSSRIRALADSLADHGYLLTDETIGILNSPE